MTGFPHNRSGAADVIRVATVTAVIVTAVVRSRERVRTFAPQRIDAVCHNPTHAAQQTTHMFARACIIRSPRRRGRAARSRNSQAERLGDHEIDDEIEFGRLVDQGIAGLLLHIFSDSA
jgi:hypothetical protein